jgi:hypothetical protein
MELMYEIVEAYRNGSELQPPVVIATRKTMAEVWAYVEHAIPITQRGDYLIIGHGRTMKALRRKS